MSREQNSFIFYRSWLEAIEAMPIDDNVKREAVYSIVKRGCGIDAGECWAVKMVDEQMAANEKRRFNGKKGGRPRKEAAKLAGRRDNEL